MRLMMFDALLPYFGNKRKLCPFIFSLIAKHIPREQWKNKRFGDPFLGSCAVSLYAKALGFAVIGADIAERSVIAGLALIANSKDHLTDVAVKRLFFPNLQNKKYIQTYLVPHVFTERHAIFLDNAFANAATPLQKYLLLKYIFRLRAFSKFSSPNAFNRPFAEGEFDFIKLTYTRHIEYNLKPILDALQVEKDRINAGIFLNGANHDIAKGNVFEFVQYVNADILYLDPPYAGTLRYEDEYEVLDKILGDEQPKSIFSGANGMEVLEDVLVRADKFPLWVISFGNAGGKNDFNKFVQMVSEFRQCEAHELAYRHCEAMASEQHKQQSREWVVLAWK